MNDRADLCGPASNGELRRRLDRFGCVSVAIDSASAEDSSPSSISRRTASDTSKPLGAGSAGPLPGAAPRRCGARCRGGDPRRGGGRCQSARGGRVVSTGAAALRSAALNTSISSGSAGTCGGTAGGIRARTPLFGLDEYSVQFPGGQCEFHRCFAQIPRLPDPRLRGGQHRIIRCSLQSIICKPRDFDSRGRQVLRFGGARRGALWGGDCKMLSARVSKSNEVSPALKALGSSARRAKALNTSPHFAAAHLAAGGAQHLGG